MAGVVGNRSLVACNTIAVCTVKVTESHLVPITMSDGVDEMNPHL